MPFYVALSNAEIIRLRWAAGVFLALIRSSVWNRKEGCRAKKPMTSRRVRVIQRGIGRTRNSAPE